MSGTIPLSLSQQFDEFGKPLSGALLYIIQAGTVATPQNAYQDAALSILLPNPITLNAAGRIPQFFLADGQIKVRLQDKIGVVQLAADNILVIGPSGGGGGGGSVDPTTVWQTGDLKARYDVAIHAGFCRANGRTIGSSSSGATELADASAQALAQHLWATDTTLPIIPSRGATAAADWSANKQFTLPDWRGCNLAALDDMGNTPAGRLTAAFFGVAATVLGARGGLESNTLGVAQVPSLSFAGTTGVDSPDHTHTYTVASSDGSQKPAGSGSAPLNNTGATQTGGASARHAHSFSGSTNGGGGAHNNVQPTKLATIYIKL
jgi:hypothetical protein